MHVDHPSYVLLASAWHYPTLPQSLVSKDYLGTPINYPWVCELANSKDCPMLIARNTGPDVEDDILTLP